MCPNIERAREALCELRAGNPISTLQEANLVLAMERHAQDLGEAFQEAFDEGRKPGGNAIAAALDALPGPVQEVQVRIAHRPAREDLRLPAGFWSDLEEALGVALGRVARDRIAILALYLATVENGRMVQRVAIARVDGSDGRSMSDNQILRMVLVRWLRAIAKNAGRKKLPDKVLARALGVIERLDPSFTGISNVPAYREDCRRAAVPFRTSYEQEVRRLESKISCKK